MSWKLFFEIQLFMALLEDIEIEIIEKMGSAWLGLVCVCGIVQLFENKLVKEWFEVSCIA